MFQLSKKVEYGLIAIRHMASGTRGQNFTAKEIAEKYRISYELLAKIMQKLARHKFIESYQGVYGGYTLTRNHEQMKVSEIIQAIEGKQAITIVQCETGTPEECNIHSTCIIKNPLVKLQNNINKVLDELTVMDMFS